MTSVAAGSRGHKQLIVGVKSARNHSGKEDEPHHQLLVSAILTDIGQNQIEIDHFDIDEQPMCLRPSAGKGSCVLSLDFPGPLLICPRLHQPSA